MAGATIGRGCNIGQNVVIAPEVVIGDNVKIQNNVSVYTGVILEDDVFCGPSVVFTNVVNPRSHVPRKDEYRRTLVKQGASIGANATVVCGITLDLKTLNDSVETAECQSCGRRYHKEGLGVTEFTKKRRSKPLTTRQS